MLKTTKTNYCPKKTNYISEAKRCDSSPSGVAI